MSRKFKISILVGALGVLLVFFPVTGAIVRMSCGVTAMTPDMAAQKVPAPFIANASE